MSSLLLLVINGVAEELEEQGPIWMAVNDDFDEGNQYGSGDSALSIPDNERFNGREVVIAPGIDAGDSDLLSAVLNIEGPATGSTGLRS